MEQSRVITSLTQISSLDGREAQGLADVRILSSRDKVTIALKRLAIFWGIAILFVPVPAVHFVAVPSFLIVGIVGFIQAFLLQKTVEKTQGLCPVCKERFEFSRLRYRERIKERCPQCRQEMYLRIEPSEIEPGAYAALKEATRPRDDGHTGYKLEKHT